MNVLFVHQNFPAQFRHLAEHLAARPQNTVVALGSETARPVAGISLVRYAVPDAPNSQTHPFARTFDADCRRVEQITYAAVNLMREGFRPDVIVVHCGWGEGIPLRTLFPAARIIVYAEMFYRRQGIDVDFDPEFPRMSLDRLIGLQTRNAATMLSLSECDAAISPTHWQKSTYPAEYRAKISVIHDGIDTDRVRPGPDATLTLPDGTVLRPGDPVVTFVARNLEPLRGYHSFMRCLPQVLRQHRSAQVMIVGGDGVSYGQSPPAGTSWKDLYLKEVADRIDRSRVHFLGTLDHEAYLGVLQVSAVHVYLTYPFVASWSLLEAMAAGCVVIGSATAPVQEIVTDGTGILVDFFDYDGIAANILTILDRGPAAYDALRHAARRSIVQRYGRDLCMGAAMDLLQGLDARGTR